MVLKKERRSIYVYCPTLSSTTYGSGCNYMTNAAGVKCGHMILTIGDVCGHMTYAIGVK